MTSLLCASARTLSAGEHEVPQCGSANRCNPDERRLAGSVAIRAWRRPETPRVHHSPRRVPAALEGLPMWGVRPIEVDVDGPCCADPENESCKESGRKSQ